MVVLDSETKRSKSPATGITTFNIFVKVEEYESNVLISTDGSSYFAPTNIEGDIYEFIAVAPSGTSMLNVHLCCDIDVTILT